MQVTFWGVRGSYPVPGPDTVRYGGHTSCVEIRSASGGRLIVDAGTGLIALGDRIAREEPHRNEHHFLLSHVHWDHIQGLPFFEPCFQAGTRIAVHALRAAAVELEDVIRGVARREFFPLAYEDLPARFEFHEVHAAKPFAAEGFHVVPFTLNHPFGAVGYRIEADGTSVSYVSDTAPFHECLHKQHFLRGLEPLTADDVTTLERMRADLREAIRGTDTVIYDTHFTPEEYARFPYFGHSTPDQAIDLCAGLGIRRLVLYHHAPQHHDEMLDEMDVHYRRMGAAAGLDIVTAFESMVLPIGPVTRPARGNPASRQEPRAVEASAAQDLAGSAGGAGDEGGQP